MPNRQKEMRQFVKTLQAAGCQVERHPGRGARWIVTTPKGERVIMAGLFGDGTGKRNFVALLRRMGVNLDHTG